MSEGGLPSQDERGFIPRLKAHARPVQAGNENDNCFTSRAPHPPSRRQVPLHLLNHRHVDIGEKTALSRVLRKFIL